MSHAKVIILGGGIAGLSAAHELTEGARTSHFEVVVYEGDARVGGKARSVDVDRGGPGEPLPGEHGFRFFPRYYRHVVDTMSRIPVTEPDGARSNVAARLHPTDDRMISRYCFTPIVVPTGLGGGIGHIGDFLALLDAVLDSSTVDIPLDARLVFAGKMYQIMTSCRERRERELETMDWMSFIEGEDHGRDYEVYLARGLSRTLVAARADLINAKTGGDVLLQFFLDVLDPGSAASTDRILEGPTSKTWLDPWRDVLLARGVRIHEDAHVQAIRMRDGRVSGVEVRHGETGPVELVDDADYVIAALPVDRMAALVTEDMIDADEVFRGVRDVLPQHVGWMLGIQYYLNRSITGSFPEAMPLVRGHATHIDSHWSVTSILQNAYWNPATHGDMSRYADGSVQGILSVIVSNWDMDPVAGDPAKCSHHTEDVPFAVDATRDGIIERTWSQLKWSLNVADGERLRDADRAKEPYLTDSLVFGADGRPAENREPLFLNHVDAQARRPGAVVPGVENLFLASDYVRCVADLATMEAANEAARRAVNGIVDAAGVNVPKCELWDLFDDDIQGPWLVVQFIKLARAMDQARFDAGLEWDAAVFERLAREFGMSPPTKGAPE